jgi:heat shock protein HslJ
MSITSVISYLYRHMERKTRYMEEWNTIISDSDVLSFENRMRGFPLCFILFPLVFACIAGCLAPSQPPAELISGTWQLVSYNTGNELAGTGPLTTITLKFGEDQRIGGNAGCNEYSGEYRTDGGLMEIRILSATEKYCSLPAGMMDMEQHYLLLLGNTTRYSIDRDELTLSYYDVTKLLVFRKQ